MTIRSARLLVFVSNGFSATSSAISSDCITSSFAISALWVPPSAKLLLLVTSPTDSSALLSSLDPLHPLIKTGSKRAKTINSHFFILTHPLQFSVTINVVGLQNEMLQTYIYKFQKADHLDQSA